MKKKPRVWKMWASYLPGARLPHVVGSWWEANHHVKAQEQPERKVIRVEVIKIVRKKK
jgi:hypothetical protein